MTPQSRIAAVAFTLVLALPAFGAECPPAVKDAALKAHAGASVSACKQETEGGKLQYEVKLLGKSGEKLELDISPEGKILQTEEYVALDAVPSAVLQGLKAKHPDGKPQRAEKQTHADGTVTYEIGFETAGKKLEASFTADGRLIEEEKEGDEGQD